MGRETPMPERLDYRHAPMVFALLCTACALAPPLQRVWWEALRQAQAAAVVAWRQKLWFFAETTAVLDPDALPAALGTPAELVGVVERLVEEHRLSRRDGTAVMEALLGQVTATGAWRR
jgi:hypothetical protein